MCQADDGVTGEGSSPSALQKTDNADAIAAKAQAELMAFSFLRRGGVVKICTGCGSVQTIPQIQKHYPNAISCCPEREMVMHRLFTAKMLTDRELKQQARREIEEAQRADEATAEERDGSLTQKKATP